MSSTSYASPTSDQSWRPTEVFRFKAGKRPKVQPSRGKRAQQSTSQSPRSPTPIAASPSPLKNVYHPDSRHPSSQVIHKRPLVESDPVWPAAESSRQAKRVREVTPVNCDEAPGSGWSGDAFDGEERSEGGSIPPELSLNSQAAAITRGPDSYPLQANNSGRIAEYGDIPIDGLATIRTDNLAARPKDRLELSLEQDREGQLLANPDLVHSASPSPLPLDLPVTDDAPGQIHSDVLEDTSGLFLEESKAEVCTGQDGQVQTSDTDMLALEEAGSSQMETGTDETELQDKPAAELHEAASSRMEIRTEGTDVLAATVEAEVVYEADTDLVSRHQDEEPVSSAQPTSDREGAVVGELLDTELVPTDVYEPYLEEGTPVLPPADTEGLDYCAVAMETTEVSAGEDILVKEDANNPALYQEHDAQGSVEVEPVETSDGAEGHESVLFSEQAKMETTDELAAEEATDMMEEVEGAEVGFGEEEDRETELMPAEGTGECEAELGDVAGEDVGGQQETDFFGEEGGLAAEYCGGAEQDEIDVNDNDSSHEPADVEIDEQADEDAQPLQSRIVRHATRQAKAANNPEYHEGDFSLTHSVSTALSVDDDFVPEYEDQPEQEDEGPLVYHSGDTDDFEMDYRPVMDRTAVKRDIRLMCDGIVGLECGADAEEDMAYKVVDRLGEGEPLGFLDELELMIIRYFLLRLSGS
jgi:hypothetical protein